MADYVKHGGHVVSFVNITNTKVLDGGEVCCCVGLLLFVVLVPNVRQCTVLGTSLLVCIRYPRPCLSNHQLPLSLVMLISGPCKMLKSHVLACYPLNVIP